MVPGTFRVRRSCDTLFDKYRCVMYEGRAEPVVSGRRRAMGFEGVSRSFRKAVILIRYVRPRTESVARR